MKNNPNFIGVYFYSLDAKNRLAIPARLRLAMERRPDLVLSSGLEGCLNLMTGTVWAKLQERLDAIALSDRAEQRAFKRMLYASASEVEFDDGGRILLPQHLVEYARIRREAAVIGMGEKIEIWSREGWAAYEKKQRDAFRRHAGRLEI